ncbi:MAG: hypothetical protein ACTMIL_12850 [Brevibacterium aurantiacum]
MSVQGQAAKPRSHIGDVEDFEIHREQLSLSTDLAKSRLDGIHDYILPK